MAAKAEKDHSGALTYPFFTANFAIPVDIREKR